MSTFWWDGGRLHKGLYEKIPHFRKRRPEDVSLIPWDIFISVSYPCIIPLPNDKNKTKDSREQRWKIPALAWHPQATGSTISLTLDVLFIWDNAWASQAVLVVKNLPASAGDVRNVGSIPGHKDPLEEGITTHSCILTRRIPWTEEPGRLQSTGSQRVGHNWSDLVHMR